MDSIQIFGGKRLQGELKVQGSKNAALPMIAAAILTDGVTILHNCPQIIDVYAMINILNILGCKVVWEGTSLIIDAKEVRLCEIQKELAGQMRSSVLLSGALLGRIQKAVIPYPGGCVIGKRPIDLHLNAFKQMNIIISEETDCLVAKTDRISGAYIELPIQSVGATENIILAGVLADGETVILNAAKEPEIVELSKMLNLMGADIRGAGTDKIRIVPVKKLNGVEVRIISDRIAAGTYTLAAAAAKSRIELVDAPVGQMESLLKAFTKMGGTYFNKEDRVILDAKAAKMPVDYLETEVYPGFPTDLQSQLLAVLVTAGGESIICENIFEARFKVAEWLNLMGADINVYGKKAVIKGVKKLHGEHVAAEELRGGAALVIAGLMAEGETIISNAHFIKRGYIDICRDLRGLGADIGYV